MKRNKFPDLRLLILDRYIIRKFLETYLFAIAMIIIILVIFDAAEKLDDFLEAHVPIKAIFLDYYLNFIPYFINQFSGLFTFIAVIFFTSKMAYQTEIIAILSSGVSFRRMLWPYFVSALLIATLSLFLNLVLIPRANSNRIEFENTYTEKNRFENNSYEKYLYRQLSENDFAFIRDYNAIGHRAGYFVLETYNGGKIVSSFESSNVTFNPETLKWSCPKYMIREYENEEQKLTKFDQPIDTMINLVADELSSTEQLIQTMNSRKLREFIEQQKAKGSDMVAIFEVEEHSRFAYPISTFILTLIGVALSSRKVRGGTGLHIGVGLSLCFSYIVLMRFAGEFAKSGMMPSYIAIWFPNFIYLIIGIYLYIKAPK